MMYKFLSILFLVFVATSCQSDPEEVKEVENEVNTNTVDNNQESNGVTNYETLYDEDVFEDPMHYALLNELNICDSILMEGSRVALCSPRNFVIRPFRNDKPIEDGFMLQVKANTILKGQLEPIPMRHLIVFEREGGALVKVNGFRGYIISSKETVSGIKDLVVRFYVPEDGGVFFNCLFVWKDGKYHYESVEEIHGAGGNGPVKEEFKEEISKDVYQSLMMHGMLF